MFAGIGGFRSGLEAAGGFRCVGYCEIDPYPRQAYEALYDTGEEVFYQDARTIDPATLPDIDLICGGFPCQSYPEKSRPPEKNREALKNQRFWDIIFGIIFYFPLNFFIISSS